MEYYLITVEKQFGPTTVKRTTFVIDETPIEWLLTFKNFAEKYPGEYGYVILYSEKITKEQYDKWGELEVDVFV